MSSENGPLHGKRVVVLGASREGRRQGGRDQGGRRRQGGKRGEARTRALGIGTNNDSLRAVPAPATRRVLPPRRSLSVALPPTTLR